MKRLSNYNVPIYNHICDFINNKFWYCEAKVVDYDKVLVKVNYEQINKRLKDITIFDAQVDFDAMIEKINKEVENYNKSTNLNYYVRYYSGYDDMTLEFHS